MTTHFDSTPSQVGGRWNIFVPPVPTNGFIYLPLTNQTATLMLSNVTPAQSGFYGVTVSSPWSRISSTGRLSAFLPASKVVAWGTIHVTKPTCPPIRTPWKRQAGITIHWYCIRMARSRVGAR